MLVHVGDWLVVPTDPGETHVRRALTEASPRPIVGLTDAFTRWKLKPQGVLRSRL